MTTYPFQPVVPTQRRCITCGEIVIDDDTWLSYPGVVIDDPEDDPDYRPDGDATFNVTYCRPACVPPLVRKFIRDHYAVMQVEQDLIRSAA